jgi:FkbM family methyltransferase
MISKIKNIIIRFISKFFNLYPLKNYFKEDSLNKILKKNKIDTIIDVGSNTGQFFLRYKRKYSQYFFFEPQKKEFNFIKKSFEKLDNVYFYNIGVGEIKEEKSFYKNTFSPSSSFMKLDDQNSFKHLKEELTEAIKIDTLDNVFSSISLKGKVLLKIDVQGFELNVLKGAVNTFSKIDFIYLEFSNNKQYQGQPSFHDLYTFLYENGYRFSFTDDNIILNGKHVQSDAFFVKENFID